MREIQFTWAGREVKLVPTMNLLSRLANEVRRETEGSETTVSLAYKCMNGGLEPMFLLIPLRAFLLEALGTQCPPVEEIWVHASSNPKDVLSFRMAYIHAVLPHVDLGKGPAAPSSAKAAAKPTPRRRSTSKAST